MTGDFFSPWWARLKHILPVISFVWAVFSGVRIGRDFSDGWRLLVFAGGIWFVLFAFSRWIDFVERAESSGKFLGGIVGKLLRERGKVEWAAFAVAQFQAQYVLLFSVPFLYWSQAWLLFLVTLVVVASTLWDPWWQKLVQYSWYECSVRSLSFVLATSFTITVVAPGLASFVQPICIAVGLIASLPWSNLLRKGLRCLITDTRAAVFIPFGVWAVFGALAFAGVRSIPLLSVWVSPQAAFGFDVVQRNLRETISGTVDSNVLRQHFAAGNKLCCWTPIVAPHSLQSKMEHVWIFNGKRVVDRIALGDVVGLDKQHAFRTYSCKSALDMPPEIERIDCRVRIEGVLDIGGVSLLF